MRAPQGSPSVVDISEQKRAEEDLRRLNLELEDRVRQRTVDLEAANAELESFSYSVSHDLRAPLRHIAGFAELLRERLAEVRDEEAQHFIDVVTRSAGEMSSLIDDLLRFSRVGRVEMHVEQVDMAALVREVLEVDREELGERRLEVTVGELPPAVGDRVLLRQVWANLLDNAVKYTRLAGDRRDRDRGRARRGPRWCTGCADNGVGFDMQYVDRLFRVFERLHRSDEFEGTGIGLANVGRIVSRHGGRCWAEAAENEGRRSTSAFRGQADASMSLLRRSPPTPGCRHRDRERRRPRSAGYTSASALRGRPPGGRRARADESVAGRLRL